MAITFEEFKEKVYNAAAINKDSILEKVTNTFKFQTSEVYERLLNVPDKRFIEYFSKKYFTFIKGETPFIDSLDKVNAFNEEIREALTESYHEAVDITRRASLGYYVVDFSWLGERCEILLQEAKRNEGPLQYVEDLLQGKYDEDIDIIYSYLEGFDYDIVNGNILIRYDEIEIEPMDHDIYKAKRKVYDTFIQFPLIMQYISQITVMVMSPTISQKKMNSAFPHINGLVTTGVCMGTTPLILSDEYIVNAISVNEYFQVYLPKQHTTSVYSQLPSANSLNRHLNTYARSIINEMPIKLNYKMFQGAKVLNMDVDFSYDRMIYLDADGMYTQPPESYADHSIFFKGKVIEQKVKVEDHISLSEYIKTLNLQSHETNQFSKLQIAAKCVETISLLYYYYCRYGKEDSVSVYEDKKSGMGRFYFLEDVAKPE